MLADENVEAVLINIFGGIVRCDMVARGVVEAAKNLGVTIPIVARLAGTNVEEGKRVLEESGINISRPTECRTPPKKSSPLRHKAVAVHQSEPEEVMDKVRVGTESDSDRVLSPQETGNWKRKK